jgi:integrase
VDLPGLLGGTEYRGQISLAVRAAIILGPHLAVRPVALVGMRWDEVDLQKGLWTIGGGRGAKLRHHLRENAPTFVVPLSETPLTVLHRLHELAVEDAEYVLPAASEEGHLTTDVLADALGRLTRKGGRLQLPGGNYRPHDARRTWASNAERLGVDRLVIERVLQHSLGKIGDTYLIAGDVERRRAAHVLVDEHWTHARSGKLATVVALRTSSS